MYPNNPYQQPVPPPIVPVDPPANVVVHSKARYVFFSVTHPIGQPVEIFLEPSGRLGVRGDGEASVPVSMILDVSISQVAKAYMSAGTMTLYVAGVGKYKISFMPTDRVLGSFNGIPRLINYVRCLTIAQPHIDKWTTALSQRGVKVVKNRTALIVGILVGGFIVLFMLLIAFVYILHWIKYGL